jgi:DNA adenine methylase
MSARPFLKWVGGKRQLLPALRERMPASFGRYFEPFVGGGALFFDVRPAHAVLGDANARLVRTYRAVRDNVEAVIRILDGYRYDREQYLAAREIDVDAFSDEGVAAWFIYMNKVGFNGLYRVNRAGRFNVPFGRYTNPTICDAANLRACSAALHGVDLRTGDFAETVADARAGDFVYFDPPYVPLSATSSFTAYAADGFGPDAQRRLRDVAAKLIDNGAHVLLSNSSAGMVRELYGERPFTVDEVDATRAVNCKAERRGAIKELVIWCAP